VQIQTILSMISIYYNNCPIPVVLSFDTPTPPSKRAWITR
jgi:hypothetical protein